MAEGNHDRNDESNRTSIWSVRTEDRFQFSIIFFTLFVLGLGLVSYYEIWVKDCDSRTETTIALIRDVGAVGLAAVVLSLIWFEGGDIVGVARDIWKRQQFNEGIAEGKRLAEKDVGRWITSNPRIKELIDEGEVESPPKLNGKNNK